MILKRTLIYKTVLISFLLGGCTNMSDYLGNIISEDREDLVVYKTGKAYEDTQYDLIIPPDLITPNATNNLEIPEYLGEEGMEIFNIDTKLENIKIIRTGRDSYISLKITDKKIIWKKLSDFWRAEGFRLIQKDFTLGSMKTDFLENLSEAQLGTVQRYVGRYIPLLVSPESRDSYSTRLLSKENTIDILITHYGKEYMSDGENEFRWQNRPRDPEFESEMISRLYIYLGGEEAKSKGYTVVKSTGVRNRTSLNIDENGIHSLFVNDIYERVWPQVIRSLDTYGVKILSSREDNGLINVTMSETEDNDSSFIDMFLFWKPGKESSSFNIVLIPNANGTQIEIQNDAFTNITNTATEEVISALYTDLR